MFNSKDSNNQALLQMLNDPNITVNDEIWMENVLLSLGHPLCPSGLADHNRQLLSGLARGLSKVNPTDDTATKTSETSAKSSQRKPASCVCVRDRIEGGKNETTTDIPILDYDKVRNVSILLGGKKCNSYVGAMINYHDADACALNKLRERVVVLNGFEGTGLFQGTNVSDTEVSAVLEILKIQYCQHAYHNRQKLQSTLLTNPPMALCRPDPPTMYTTRP
jgi:hypothetical protein